MLSILDIKMIKSINKILLLIGCVLVGCNKKIDPLDNVSIIDKSRVEIESLLGVYTSNVNYSFYDDSITFEKDFILHPIFDQPFSFSLTPIDYNVPNQYMKLNQNSVGFSVSINDSIISDSLIISTYNNLYGDYDTIINSTDQRCEWVGENFNIILRSYVDVNQIHYKTKEFHQTTQNYYDSLKSSLSLKDIVGVRSGHEKHLSSLDYNRGLPENTCTIEILRKPPKSELKKYYMSGEENIYLEFQVIRIDGYKSYTSFYPKITDVLWEITFKDRFEQELYTEEFEMSFKNPFPEYENYMYFYVNWDFNYPIYDKDLERVKNTFNSYYMSTGSKKGVFVEFSPKKIRFVDNTVLSE